MDLRVCLLFVCFLISLSVMMMPGRSGGRQTKGELFPGVGVSSHEVDEDMVERLWIKCGLDPLSIYNIIKGQTLSILRDINTDSTEMDLKLRLLTEAGIQEAITNPSHDINKLLECMSKHYLQFPMSDQDEILRNKFIDYLESPHGRNPVARRHLVDHPLPGLSPDSVSTPSLPPNPSPSPSSGLAKIPSPGPGVKLHVPTSEPDHSTASNPRELLSTITIDHIPSSAPALSSNTHSHSNNSVIIPMALTAVATALFCVCLFRCYMKRYKNKLETRFSQRDDRPLLALSLSDFSGSSQKSYGLASSINCTKFGSLSSKMETSQDDPILPFETNSSETTAPGQPSGISDSSCEPPSSQTVSPAPPPVPPPVPPPACPRAHPPAPPAPPPAPKAPPPPVMPPPVKKVASGPPAPPPPAPRAGPQPPPPPKNVTPPRPPLGTATSSRVKLPSPLGPKPPNPPSPWESHDANGQRAKLKPFFWEKVLANPDDSMVWHQLKAGSFQFNEEMIESLFGYTSASQSKNDNKREIKMVTPQRVQLLEAKKSQNLAISIKAMGVKLEEVCDALMEGNELPAELLQTLIRMSPTVDEELKLRLYTGEASLLGPAERFLKVLVDIPFAFKRMDVLLFMSSLSEDKSHVEESFESIEVACKELLSSRLFRKLLEAVLKTGNRMNVGTFRGEAEAFKLDTLLKLLDVKGTDGKTTLLHFVIQEIIRSEGVRAARTARESRSLSSLTTSSLGSVDLTEDFPPESGECYQTLGLKVVSCLSSELENVKKAASLDAEALTALVMALGYRLVKSKEFLNTDMKSLEEDSGFHRFLKSFVEHAEKDVTILLEEEKRIRLLVKNTTDYFHGNTSKDEGLRLFVVVRDFLGMVDKACREIKEARSQTPKTTAPKAKEDLTTSSLNDQRRRLFPAIRDPRMDSSSSSDSD